MPFPTRFRIFIILLAGIAASLVFLATSNFGPGVSTDGARYLATAENLLAGRGDVDFLGDRLTQFPPLYPLMIAALRFVTGFDVLIAGQWINVIAIFLVVLFSGLLFEASFPTSQSVAIGCSLIVAFSLPLMQVSANIASDSLFMVGALAFLLTSQRYLGSPVRARWLVLIVVAALACFVRYAGFALVISGAAATVAVWRSKPLRAIGEALAFTLLSSIPITMWGFFHNLPVTGALFGRHANAEPIGNSISAIEKVVSWFFPAAVLNLTPVWMYPIAIIGFLLALGNKKRWHAWLQKAQSSAILPSLIFILVYGAMLIFAVSTSEHRFLSSQRIHVIILPSLLVAAVITARSLLPRPSASWLHFIFGLFGFWLAFPAGQVWNYVSSSREKGDVSEYNIFNTRALVESDIVRKLRESSLNEFERIYSNNEAAAWFYVRREIRSLPRCQLDLCADYIKAAEAFPGWPSPSERAILLWFERELDYKDQIPTPEKLQEVIPLEIIFLGRNGDMYLLAPGLDDDNRPPP